MTTDPHELLAELAEEIARQDRLHPTGFPATRDGIRLGLAAAWDEWEEARLAHRAERCKCGTPQCGHATWPMTRAELLQAAGVIMRTIRSITEAAAPADDASPVGCIGCEVDSAVQCSDGPANWGVIYYVGKGKGQQEHGRRLPMCQRHATYEESWTAATGAIRYAVAYPLTASAIWGASDA